MLVKFNNSLAQAAYDALTPKDAGTLYFITDTKRIYKGSEVCSEDVTVLTALPATGISNRLYVINDGTNISSYIWNGSAFKQVGAAPLSSVMTDIGFDEATQKFTFTFSDGSKKEIDLVLESVIKDVAYNNTTKILTFTLVSGAKTTVSLVDLVGAYAGADTTTAKTAVDENGIIKVNIKISSAAGNQMSDDGTGLFVKAYDGSGKMDKVTGAVNGNIGILNSAGQITDSGKKFTTTIRVTGAADDSIPTELGVRNAIDTALTWN